MLRIASPLAAALLAAPLLGALPGAALAQDMLKPSQVNYEGESANPANDSGLFLGAGASFGQGYATEGGSAGLAYLLHVEPGYQINTGSWSRLELSADLFAGKLRARLPDPMGRTDLNVGFGGIAKLGYGYSIGGKMFGLVKAGVGPVLARLEADTPAGKAKSDGTISGLATMIGWEMVVPATSALDFTGGISFTHYQFDVGDLELAGGTKYAYDRGFLMNVPEARVGLRLRI